MLDLWGGVAHTEANAPWRRDTVGVIFSSTKGLTAICMLMLVDRGLLDLDAPIATYWPELATDGRASLTTRTILNHRSGLCAVDRPLTLEDLGDPATLAEAMEAQAPLWEPGTDQGYHGVTMGILAGEIFRRVTGENIGTFFAREVAGAVRADAWIGLPPDVRERMATVYPPRATTKLFKALPQMLTDTVEGRVYRAALRRESTTSRAFRNPAYLGPRGIPNYNDPRVHALELPWANGVANARGLSRIYAALIGGDDWEGPRLVSDESLLPLHGRQSWSERDRVILKPLGFSQGFIKEEGQLFSRNPSAFGHPGAGGILGWCDPDAGLAIGYVMNQMDFRIRSPRAIALCHALYACL